MPFWGVKPEEEKPERKKAIAAYERIPLSKNSEARHYLLAQDIEIYTPLGRVDARAGDVLRVDANGLWVLAAEILRDFGAEIKPK